jgi:hypothetical protein
MDLHELDEINEDELLKALDMEIPANSSIGNDIEDEFNIDNLNDMNIEEEIDDISTNIDSNQVAKQDMLSTKDDVSTQQNDQATISINSSNCDEIINLLRTLLKNKTININITITDG